MQLRYILSCFGLLASLFLAVFWLTFVWNYVKIPVCLPAGKCKPPKLAPYGGAGYSGEPQVFISADKSLKSSLLNNYELKTMNYLTNYPIYHLTVYKIMTREFIRITGSLRGRAKSSRPGRQVKNARRRGFQSNPY